MKRAVRKREDERKRQNENSNETQRKCIEQQRGEKIKRPMKKRED
jgi:hypothetical protein